MANKKETKCIVCGAIIEYSTKRPEKCATCKKNTNTVRLPKGKAKSNQTKWKNESEMYKVLSNLLPRTQYCTSGYYSWLPSPKNQPMQLDWYSYELGIAFEYNGIQHYSYTKYFHKTKQEFLYLLECDKLKKELCDQEGITLISIRYDTDLNVRSIANEIRKQNKKLYLELLKEKQLNLTAEDIKAINNIK